MATSASANTGVIGSGTEITKSLPRPYSTQSWLIVCALLAVGALYGGVYLKRGWIPHDAGAYALAAERVLRGELPHRDFIDLYSGGLTLLNAATMRVFGVNLVAIRYPVFLLFLAWIPAVFNLARRFASERAAALATLLAIAMSLPNYSEAVPSWYNLFFATFGVLALFRFTESRCTESRITESGSRRWLVVAGGCSGLSFLAKIAGLYFLAAALLFLLYREQELDRRSDQRSAPNVFNLVAITASAVFVFLLVRLIHWNHAPRYWIHFVIPGVALVSLLVWREFAATYTAPSRRFRRLFGDALALLGGFAAPVVLFLVPYAATGSLLSWFQGVFVFSAKRLTYASLEPSNLKWVRLLATGVLTYTLVAACDLRQPLRRNAKILIAVLLATSVVVAGFQKGTYHFLWDALVLLVPATAVVAAFSRRISAQAFALVATTVLCNLIQYPYAAPIYLVYVLPLLLLAWFALIAAHADYSRFLSIAVALTYLAFFVLRVTPSYVNAMGVMNTGEQQTYELHLPRAAGIRVKPAQGQMYERVISLIQQHRQGEYIFAAPDAPELYFLSGSKSPSRALFDFLEEPGDPRSRIHEFLAVHQIKLVVIKTPEQTDKKQLGTPGFSPSLDPEFVAEIRNLYPESETVGTLEVRWKP
jgi:4-amino-4-deoxy-L-arabinose transferase-like glycosyltransferase